jgi:hypothetical protein
MKPERFVDVYNTQGRRIYIRMIDDFTLPYLHWGTGYGFVPRTTVAHERWTLKEVS